MAAADERHYAPEMPTSMATTKEPKNSSDACKTTAQKLCHECTLWPLARSAKLPPSWIIVAASAERSPSAATWQGAKFYNLLTALELRVEA